LGYKLFSDPMTGDEEDQRSITGHFFYYLNLL